ncbi:MAG TPA: formylglycine-generating enzyme family protein, partial [Candidatus Hydrogenedentes bacterium]|nr:formylglycine-generating enzyme family protein [Candidatus Hydrogenedentota bacterium]
TYGLGNTYPAYYISWDDTKNFITSLNAHIVSSGQGPLTVRLPSEAEWEYACRAGTTTRFYFGDSLRCDGLCTDCAAGTLPGNRTAYMWYCGNNSPSGSKAVGGKTANAFGLYDMSGNVYEWCEDDYHSSYTGAPTNGSAWVDSPRASYRMIRGGFWYYYARSCRSAFRLYGTPGIRYIYVGFRLAAVR